jgi:hypothetical protein
MTEIEQAPTQWAYDQACRALAKWRGIADQRGAELMAVRKQRAEETNQHAKQLSDVLRDKIAADTEVAILQGKLVRERKARKAEAANQETQIEVLESENERLCDLLATLWIHTRQFQVKQLTTDQKELFYDVVEDALRNDENREPLERWWRE